MPTERQLETFVTAATETSFRRAAELLGVSQPSISKQIKALESAVGGKLFFRHRGASAKLTPLGRSLFQDAKRTLQMQKRLRSNGSSSEPEPVFEVFLRHFLLNIIKPNIDELIERGLPENINFVVVDDSNELILRVQNTKHSFGLLRTSRLITAPNVQSLLMREDSCSLYAAPELSNAIKRKELSLRALPILLFEERSGLNDWAIKSLEAVGMTSDQFSYGPQFVEHLVGQVLKGRGAAIFIDSHASEFVKAGQLVRLNVPISPLFYILLANAEITAGQLSKFSQLFRSL